MDDDKVEGRISGERAPGRRKAPDGACAFSNMVNPLGDASSLGQTVLSWTTVVQVPADALINRKRAQRAPGGNSARGPRQSWDRQGRPVPDRVPAGVSLGRGRSWIEVGFGSDIMEKAITSFRRFPSLGESLQQNDASFGTLQDAALVAADVRQGNLRWPQSLWLTSSRR